MAKKATGQLWKGQDQIWVAIRLALGNLISQWSAPHQGSTVEKDCRLVSPARPGAPRRAVNPVLPARPQRRQGERTEAHQPAVAPLPLPLFVPRIRTKDADHSPAAYDLAFRANGLDR